MPALGLFGWLACPLRLPACSPLRLPMASTSLAALVPWPYASRPDQMTLKGLSARPPSPLFPPAPPFPLAPSFPPALIMA